MKFPRVADMMTKDVFAVAPETSLIAAARLLANRHITGAPVVDPTGRVIGVLTLADLADPDRSRSDRLGSSLFYYRAHGQLQIAHGEAPVTAEGVVGDVMSPFVLSVSAKASLLDAVRLMLADDVHRLFVLDEGRLLGIITTMDVLRAISNDVQERLPRTSPAPEM
jgi:predicted transcriptional regulator